MAISLDDLKQSRGAGIASLRTENQLKGKNELTAQDGLKQLRIQQAPKGNLNPSNFRGNFMEKAQRISAQIVDAVDAQLREFSLELIFVIDSSGSCNGTEKSTMEGFSTLIRQEKTKGYVNTKVTVDLFDEETKTLYDRVPIANVSPIEYDALGRFTALYNALGKRIENIKAKHQKEGAPTKTLVVIMTDGQDNVSRVYTESSIRSLIKERKQAGWEFLFLGAMRTVEETKHYAEILGISSEHAQLYLPEQVATNFYAIESAIEQLRNQGKIDADWSEVIKDTLPPQLGLESGRTPSIEDKNNLSLRLGRKK